MDKKNKALSKKKKESKTIQKVQGTDINSLIQMALENKSGMEQLKELIQMKYNHEDREARKIFHKDFCKMQSEFPAINKTKEVKNKNGDLIYKYAPLESIVAQILPYLNKHGFSYHWTESSDGKEFKRITCHITHSAGHSISAFTDVPIMPSNYLVNSIQQAGSSSTYGKRYSFSGVLGIMVDDDLDGKISNMKSKNTNKNTEQQSSSSPKDEIKNVTPKTELPYDKRIENAVELLNKTINFNRIMLNNIIMKKFKSSEVNELSEEQKKELIEELTKLYKSSKSSGKKK